MVRKWHNQKEISTAKTEMGKAMSKLGFEYLYWILEYI